MKFFYLLFLVATISCSGQSGKDATHSNNEVSEVVTINQVIAADQFEQKLANTKEFNLIDVRTMEEVEAGFIKGAVNYNFYESNFNEKIGALNKDIPTFVYCKSGGRSGKCAKVMEELGFKEVYDLKGGFTKWANEGNLIDQL